jgi:hypothetical protein
LLLLQRVLSIQHCWQIQLITPFLHACAQYIKHAQGEERLLDRIYHYLRNHGIKPAGKDCNDKKKRRKDAVLAGTAVPPPPLPVHLYGTANLGMIPMGAEDSGKKSVPLLLVCTSTPARVCVHVRVCTTEQCASPDMPTDEPVKSTQEAKLRSTGCALTRVFAIRTSPQMIP